MPPASQPKAILTDTWGRNNRRLSDRCCPNCGAIFRPLRDSSKYCSRPCLWANNGGHNKKAESWWINGRGYVEGRIWVGNEQRRVKLHRLIMERYLGRPLMADEDVHQINGNKQDNQIENLQVLSHGEHSVITNVERWAIARATGEKA